MDTLPKDSINIISEFLEDINVLQLPAVSQYLLHCLCGIRKFNRKQLFIVACCNVNLELMKLCRKKCQKKFDPGPDVNCDVNHENWYHEVCHSMIHVPANTIFSGRSVFRSGKKNRIDI